MAKNRLTKKQELILRLLDQLARQTGLRISYGQLRFAGLKLKGGQCLYRGRKWLVIDRQESFEGQVELFREALTRLDLTGLDIPPELQGYIAQRQVESLTTGSVSDNVS
ncbi:MAG: hypothetical protein HQK55_00035 [Deltaproteobacteria bacterium]|nr:hypothetical protein [Deltaproteobacteria bacterium]